MISLCMIVKNEEKYIKQCIEHVIDIVDEIIIVDTGCTDNTINILCDGFVESIKLVKFDWINDFSAARNKSLEYATKEWILILDADEVIKCDKIELTRYLENTKSNVINIPIINIVDQGLPFLTANMPRLFKRRDAIYNGQLHEQLSYNGITPAGDVLNKNIAEITHYGYLSENIADKDKMNRNKNLLKTAISNNPDNAYNWYKLGVTHISDSEFDLALEAFFKWGELELDTAPAYYSDVVIRVSECLYNLRKYSELEEYLVEHLEDPVLNKNPDFYCRLGQLYKTLDKNKKALEYYIKAVSLGEKNVQMAAAGTGSFKPKFEIAEILLKEKSINDGILFYIDGVFGIENINMFGIDRLLKTTQNKKKIDLKNFLYNESHKISKMNEDNGSIDGVKRKKLLKDNEKEIDEIEAFINAGRLEEAKVKLRDYEKINEFDSRIYSLKGIFELFERNNLKAFAYFIIGLRFNSEDYDLLYNAAYSAEQLEAYNSSLMFYKRCLKIARFADRIEVKRKIAEIEVKCR